MGSLQALPDLEGLLERLTLEEKISLLAGQDFWQTVAIPRLSIPSLKFSDGPNGARGSQFDGGKAGACFPASVCLAATWDRDTVYKVGTALAAETKTKGAVALLGPTICPHRSPLGGRNFESFSEDPLLGGQLAASYIRGLQDHGVAAIVKHFAGNEQETLRRSMNVKISDRALRELYLRPFEIAVKYGDPWAIMTSYNLLNGIHTDMNRGLLQEILRDQWSFKGMVVSDWGGTNSSVDSINAGLDLEMPGPTTWRKVDAILQAVKENQLSAKTIEARAREVIRLVQRTGKFENPETPAERYVPNPEFERLIRDIGADGAVLLKNENNILPLQRDKVKSIALLGLAKECLMSGGGSARMNAPYKVSPFDAITEALEETGADIRYARGAHLFRNFEPMQKDVYAVDGAPGLTLTRYSNREFAGEPDEVSTVDRAAYRPHFQNANSRQVQACLRLETAYRPSASGSHYLCFSGIGRSKLLINDEVIFDREGVTDPVAFILGASEEERTRFPFVQGREYRIVVESKARLTDPSRKTNASFFDGLLSVRLGFMTEAVFEEKLLPDAIAAATGADFAICFVGNTAEWETEGQDARTMSLPAHGTQDALIEAVAQVNSNTIVVNSTGVAVSMPWLPSVPAILQAWFGGQEAGNSIADILFGDANPGGRLPVTIPKSMEDAAWYGNFPGDLEKPEVVYAEDVFVGYRYYDSHPELVQFPFGFGLSYTSFDIAVEKSTRTPLSYGESLMIRARVTNTGKVAGSETVQVYVGSPMETIKRPPKTLAGFAKIRLIPGASETVEIDISFDSLSSWDEETSRWRIDRGTYTVQVARSSTDTVDISEIEVREDIAYGPERLHGGRSG